MINPQALIELKKIFSNTVHEAVTDFFHDRMDLEDLINLLDSVKVHSEYMTKKTNAANQCQQAQTPEDLIDAAYNPTLEV